MLEIVTQLSARRQRAKAGFFVESATAPPAESKATAEDQHILRICLLRLSAISDITLTLLTCFGGGVFVLSGEVEPGKPISGVRPCRHNASKISQ